MIYSGLMSIPPERAAQPALQIIRDVIVAKAPNAGALWPLQLLRAYSLLLYGTALALLRFVFLEWPRRLLDGLLGKNNSGWVGH